MTEDEYINATNLAKLRIAVQVLADVLPHGPVDETVWRSVHVQINNMTDKLEAVVKTRPSRKST